MNIVCEVCGDIGIRQLLLCCRECERYAVHQYCLDKVVYNASLIKWFCYECLQRRGEVTCARSLEQVSSKRPLNHAHSGSPVHQLSTKRVESVRDERPYSPNGNSEELFSCPGIEKIPSVRERSVDPINISGISDDTVEASESNERFSQCQKASSCSHWKTVKMAMASSSSEESGEDTMSERGSLEYVLACRTYLSQAQKKRVMKLIQEIQPEFTIFISVMRRNNVQPPGPYLGITKEYANAHFPDKTTNITLETPGKSKKWYTKFYKRDKTRKNLLQGRWLDFVRDNHLQEGDICLLLPKKDEIRYTFMIYILHETTHSRGGAGFQRISPCPGSSSAKMASEIHIEEEPTAGEYVSSESDIQEISHEPLESVDFDDPFEPPYFVPCKNPLSRSQKRIVEKRVRAIRSEVTCARSLEQVSSKRPLSHAHSGSPVHQLSTKRVESVRDERPYSPNGDSEELFSRPGIEKIPSVRERSVDPINISGISQHDTTEVSASNDRFTECQKSSSCRLGKTVKRAMASSSSDETGEDIPSEKVFLEYVLAYRCYLSEAQKKRVMELIQEIQPEFTIFISIMRRGNVQPPGPYLGLTRDYASAHFPDESTNVTLETPGKSKKWHPKFYRRDESRNYMLIGQWLDFVRDNHVHEGDICLLVPTKDEIRCTFMVYVLHETTDSRGRAGFQMGGPCPGASSAKTASEIHIEAEPTAGEHVSSESDMQEIPHEPLEGGDSDDDLFVPEYIVPCKSPLSKSQKRIVEERVRSIQSEIPICVAVMKNNNVGVAQRWMLELGSRYGSVYLPTKGQTIWLQCGGKTWKAKMMFHNGRRWFLNGGWPNFARGNGLRVGDICLFELKKKESKLTMAVHIIRREKF